VGHIYHLDEESIEELLRTAIVGRIACGHPDVDDGRPYLVPLAYGYDGESILAHSEVGKKIRIMRLNPLVTIEVDHATAADGWRSVIAKGTYEEIHDQTERDATVAIIYPDPNRRPTFGSETIIYRIRLTEKSGRYEVPE
jgi:nitroimidazol reductase NimA-like FMN-containing flavoprotein (pyridoxamine 5'-phosphate oxidase superfamily)